MTPFADALVDSPIGAALVAALERGERPNHARLEDDPSTDAVHVAKAAQHVASLSPGEFIELIDDAADNVGPWISDADVHAWAAYLHAPARLPIAQAIERHFGAQLQQPLDIGAQELWLSAGTAGRYTPSFTNLDHVYDNGELSWGALRSHTSLPPGSGQGVALDAPEPMTRWKLPVVGEPRVFEVHRPEDWYDLCLAYPRRADREHGGWSLPGQYEPGPDSPLFTISGQRAALRPWMLGTHLCPQWSRLAVDYDAVHVSWAGFITAEGCVHTHGTITTMLRFWSGEQTLWVRDFFGELEPLPRPQSVPVPEDAYDGWKGVIDPRSDPERLANDQRAIAAMLGRD